MNVNNNENLGRVPISTGNQNEIYAEWNTKQTFINSIYNFDKKEGLSSEEEYLTLKNSLGELRTWFQNVKDNLAIVKRREITSFIDKTERNLEQYLVVNGEPNELHTDLHKDGYLNDGYETEVLPTMQCFANEALSHMVNNGGKLEGFNFVGLPIGIEVQNVELVEDRSNSVNDTYTYNNGQGEVHRNVDFRQVKITFTYNNKLYTIQEGYTGIPIQE